MEDDADEQKIIRNFKNLIKPRPDAECEKVIASNILERKYFDSNQILESKLIEQYDEGCIVLSGIAQRVFEYFDKVFLGFIKEYQPISKQFPTLLPLTTVNDTNYLNTSPQYLLFCSKVHESIDEYSQVQQKYNDGKMLNTINSPEFTLSPSACFHLFGYLRKKKIIT